MTFICLNCVTMWDTKHSKVCGKKKNHLIGIYCCKISYSDRKIWKQKRCFFDKQKINISQIETLKLPFYRLKMCCVFSDCLNTKKKTQKTQTKKIENTHKHKENNAKKNKKRQMQKEKDNTKRCMRWHVSNAQKYSFCSMICSIIAFSKVFAISNSNGWLASNSHLFRIAAKTFVF